jgi:hypothetical protein
VVQGFGLRISGSKGSTSDVGLRVSLRNGLKEGDLE